MDHRGFLKWIVRWWFRISAAVFGVFGAGAFGLMLVYAVLSVRNWFTGEYDYLSYGTVGWEVWQRFSFDVSGYAPGHAAWHPVLGWFFDIDRFFAAGIICGLCAGLAWGFCALSRRLGG